MSPPASAAPLAAAIADAHTTVLADAGHMMMVEQPNETIDTIDAFLGALA